MPIYTYRCENEKCRYQEEHVNKWAERDQTYECPSCGGVMRWRGAEVPSSLSGKENYQMSAILADGRKVKGHFGKSAKRQRRS